jgi:hypothetical protein
MGPLSFRWAAGLSHCRMRMGRKLMNPVPGELGDRCTLLNATVQPLYESLGIKAIRTPFTSIRA